MVVLGLVLGIGLCWRFDLVCRCFVELLMCAF